MTRDFSNADSNPATAYELGRHDERLLTDAAIRAAVAAEQEACAKELDIERECWTEDVVCEVLQTMAAVIRERTP